MLYRVLFVSSLLSLFSATHVAAQSYSSVAVRISISTPARTLGINQRTDLRVALLDQKSGATPANRDTFINLIATKATDINRAKSDASAAANTRPNGQGGGVLTLPAKSNTVQMTIVVRRGQSEVVVPFVSQQSGTVRLYAESERLVTGSALIAVVAQTNRVMRTRARLAGRTQTNSFTPVAFQPARTAQPAPDKIEGVPLQLSLEAEGTDVPPIIDGEWVRKLSVMLKSGEELVPADEEVSVKLRIDKGAGNLSKWIVTIPKDGVISEVVELHTRTGGDIEVSARLIRRGAFAPAFVRTVFNFPSTRRATKLLIDAIPLTALANGIQPIKLQVRAVDDDNNPIRSEDEGMDARRVVFSLQGTTLGIRFDNDLTAITIPPNEEVAEVKVFGAYPVAGTKVIAESANSTSGGVLKGSSEIMFLFPWWQLSCAVLGGLIIPLMNRFLRQQPQPLTPKRIYKYLLESASGGVIGGIFFGLVFFGAVVMNEIKWGGVPLMLTNLPVQNAFAALLIGLIGGEVVNFRSYLKRRAVVATRSGKSTPA